MQILFEMTGGFAYAPGLSKPIAIDTTRVDKATAEQLESLVQLSHFFELPVRLDTTAAGAADYITYVITVRDGSRAHTVQLTDPVGDANIERLVVILKKLAR